MKLPTKGSSLSRIDQFALHYNKVQGTHNMNNDDFHDHYEMYYLVSGKRDYFIKDKVYPIQKGDLVLIPPYVLHRTIDAGAPAYERFLAHFRESFVGPFLDPSCNLLLPFHNEIYHLSLSIPEQRILENLIQRMMQEMGGKPWGYETCLKALMTELLLFINRWVSERQEEEILVPDFTRYQKRISDVASYINEYFYMKSLSLSKLSERFCISTGYLSGMFKEVSGFSLTEYINLVRIKEAQKLLRETKWKVQDIADKAGFDNISHFGRVFKQISGMPPMQYRYLYRRKGKMERLTRST